MPDVLDVPEALERDGFALLPKFVDAEQAMRLRALYDADELFRSRVIMQKHAYGRGEYKYFANPLPDAVRTLREELYRDLQPIANAWMAAGGSSIVFPSSHAAFLHECFEAEQTRPTALLLRYGPGDFNCLHQDIYGPVAFPLQATIYLSRPGQEFGGGEVVLTQSRPRAQTRAHVLAPQQGDLLVLPSRGVARAGVRGRYNATFKHGVGTVAWGQRFAMGIIFHDAL